MDNKEPNQNDSQTEQRRRQFAPHTNPKKQADGDPGSNSTRENLDDEQTDQSTDTLQKDSGNT